ncbi:MAG: response regulator [Deltaproteobacteria bacterium]|nr:response regulator [Deltaproteobacteria bacterium]
MTGKTILLVDADAKSQRVVEVALRKAGFEVASCATADAALTSFGQQRAELVLTEARLPDASGLDLLARLRATDPSVSVIVVSNDRSKDARIRAIQAGATDYLNKPLFAREVVARALAMFEHREGEAGARRSGPEAVEGTLASLGLVDALQIIEAGQKTGVLEVRTTAAESRGLVSDADPPGQIWFENGWMVDAEIGRRRGEEALYRMLCFDDGTYVFASGPVGRHESPVPIASLLIEGLARVDEWARLWPRLPELGTQLRVDYRKLAGQMEGLPAEIHELLPLFDGRRTIRDALDEADLRDHEFLTAVARLMDDSLLVEGSQEARPASTLGQWLSKAPGSPTRTPVPIPRAPSALLSRVRPATALPEPISTELPSFEDDLARSAAVPIHKAVVPAKSNLLAEAPTLLELPRTSAELRTQLDLGSPRDLDSPRADVPAPKLDRPTRPVFEPPVRAQSVSVPRTEPRAAPTRAEPPRAASMRAAPRAPDKPAVPRPLSVAEPDIAPTELWELEAARQAAEAEQTEPRKLKKSPLGEATEIAPPARFLEETGVPASIRREAPAQPFSAPPQHRAIPATKSSPPPRKSEPAPPRGAAPANRPATRKSEPAPSRDEPRSAPPPRPSAPPPVKPAAQPSTPVQVLDPFKSFAPPLAKPDLAAHSPDVDDFAHAESRRKLRVLVGMMGVLVLLMVWFFFLQPKQETVPMPLPPPRPAPKDPDKKAMAGWPTSPDEQIATGTAAGPTPEDSEAHAKAAEAARVAREAEAKAAEAKAAEAKAEQLSLAEAKAAEAAQRATDAEAKAAEAKAARQREAEAKAAETAAKAARQREAEAKAAEAKAARQREAEAKAEAKEQKARQAEAKAAQLKEAEAKAAQLKEAQANAKPASNKTPDGLAIGSGGKALAKAEKALAAEDFVAARAELNEVVRRDPRNANAHAGLAFVHYATGELSAARRVAKWALELDPKNARALLTLGSAALEEGDPKAALEAFKRFLTAAPKHPRAAEIKRLVADLEKKK